MISKILPIIGAILGLCATFGLAQDSWCQTSTSQVTPSVPDVGKLETVPVRATGRGRMASEAVSDAIKSAILQVNGTTVDIHSTQFDGAIGISVGRKEIELQSSGFAQLVSQNSRGAVTGFRIVSIAKSDAEQQYSAVIDAS